jgi:hypothetical protein
VNVVGIGPAFRFEKGCEKNAHQKNFQALAARPSRGARPPPDDLERLVPSSIEMIKET